MNTKLKQLKLLLDNKTQSTWTASGNLPFYAELDKPAPSLSKHDSERPTYWRVQDVEFVLAMANGGVQALFDEIERLKR